MEIRVADCIGLCFGVKRAIGLARRELEKGNRVFSVGPIVHNLQVVDELAERGLEMVEDLDSVKEGLFLVRSHGVGPHLRDEARRRGLRLIDTTCPFVKKNQELVKSLSKEGYKILIIGEGSHPEVRALRDYAGGEALVISSKIEAQNLDLKDKLVSVIAQTTQSQTEYLGIVSLLPGKGPRELRIFNTICQETLKRQEACGRLAEEVDMMLVIGGKDSANTSRLVKICRDMGKEAHHIEEASELDLDWLSGKRSVGISSGASTPEWVINEVVDKLKTKEVLT